MGPDWAGVRSRRLESEAERLSGVPSCGVVSALSPTKFEFSLAGHAERKMVLAARAPPLLREFSQPTS